MLTNAGEVALELNLIQLHHHPDICDATLAPVSYCEPALNVCVFVYAFMHV